MKQTIALVILISLVVSCSNRKTSNTKGLDIDNSKLVLLLARIDSLAKIDSIARVADSIAKSKIVYPDTTMWQADWQYDLTLQGSRLTAVLRIVKESKKDSAYEKDGDTVKKSIKFIDTVWLVPITDTMRDKNQKPIKDSLGNWKYRFDWVLWEKKYVKPNFRLPRGKDEL